MEQRAYQHNSYFTDEAANHRSTMFATITVLIVYMQGCEHKMSKPAEMSF